MSKEVWITLEDLLEESAPTEEEDRILDHLKLLTQESLPDGWKNWKICLERTWRWILRY